MCDETGLKLGLLHFTRAYPFIPGRGGEDALVFYRCICGTLLLLYGWTMLMRRRQTSSENEAQVDHRGERVCKQRKEEYTGTALWHLFGSVSFMPPLQELTSGFTFFMVWPVVRMLRGSKFVK